MDVKRIILYVNFDYNLDYYDTYFTHLHIYYNYYIKNEHNLIELKKNKKIKLILLTSNININIISNINIDGIDINIDKTPNYDEIINTIHKNHPNLIISLSGYNIFDLLYKNIYFDYFNFFNYINFEYFIEMIDYINVNKIILRIKDDYLLLNKIKKIYPNMGGVFTTNISAYWDMNVHIAMNSI